MTRLSAYLGIAFCAAQSIALIGADGTPRKYSSPEELALSVDGHRLYVSCPDSDEIVAIDTTTGRVTARVPVGRKPRGITIAGSRVYVANSWADTVSEVDTTAMRVTRTWAAGREPIGIVVDQRSGAAFVANRIGGDVSVIGLAADPEFRSIPIGAGASYVIAGPRRDRIWITRVFPTVEGIREVPHNEIVEIDTARREVVARFPLPGVGAAFRGAMAGRGGIGFAAVLRPKNLLPTAQVEHGGIFGNSIAVFEPAVKRVVMLPLDGIDDSLAQPFDVAIAPDLSTIFISASGADEVAMLDGRILLSAARAPGAARSVNDLSAASHYLLKRIAVGRNPRGLALSADGKRLYAANHLDDTVTVIDAIRGSVLQTITVGESSAVTPQRRGEQHFYSARFAFARQFSCSSCHLDAISDGLTWDLAQDDFGLNPVATKPLEALADTAPYKWNGTTPDLETECGALSEQYFFRSQGFRNEELSAVVSFLKSIPVRPNRNRLLSGRLTPAQARGKAIFDRSVTRDGRLVLSTLQCRACHYGPAMTSNQLADVGTRAPTDRTGLFDTPALTNICYKSSFLHDGSARALKDLWTLRNPHDLHGVSSDMAASDIDDLVEYLKSL